MIELRGKYNSCKVFTDNVDSACIGQLTALLNQECVKGETICVMPDCHASRGSVVGTTMILHNTVIPNIVGSDIGCGMLVIKLKNKKIDFPALDSIIRKYIPCGMDINDEPVSSSPIDKLFADVNLDKAYRSLGTLGGGNHFIEVDKDSEGYLYLVIHSGSRHLGVDVCKYYQDLAYKRVKESGVTGVPYELSYLRGSDFDNYLHDMKLAQEHASINREAIAKRIMKRAKLKELERFETVHNYINTDAMVLRKGAVSAHAGEKLIIPMNMRDGALICEGLGNPDWNCSAPHGAGRLMSRSEAKESISVRDFRDSMSGVYTTCIGRGTIDESPMTYKPMQEILDNIQDTVRVLDIIKPVYNFKASVDERRK